MVKPYNTLFPSSTLASTSCCIIEYWIQPESFYSVIYIMLNTVVLHVKYAVILVYMYVCMYTCTHNVVVLKSEVEFTSTGPYLCQHIIVHVHMCTRFE